jgi:hypothetical protein
MVFENGFENELNRLEIFINMYNEFEFSAHLKLKKAWAALTNESVQVHT